MTVTGCEVSYDRSYCNVFYTSDPGTYEEAAAGFSAARGRIRSLMGARLTWRVTPELRFLLDPSVDEAERIARVLAHEASRIPVPSETECETADADDAAHADRSFIPCAKDAAATAKSFPLFFAFSVRPKKSVLASGKTASHSAASGAG